MEAKNIHVNAENGLLVIREGDAHRIIEPKGYGIRGNISAPAIWLTAKEKDIETVKAYVTVNRRDACIRLTLNCDQENGRIESYVTGTMKFDERFKAFKINTNQRWELNDLATLLKYNRRFFTDPAKAMELVSALKSFKASVSREIEAASDDRGNSRRLQDKKVSTYIPDTFSLSIPIFEGDISFDFDVEICIEEKEGLVRAWLQSVEAEEITEKRIDYTLKSEIETFTEHGIAVIFE